MLIAAFPAGPWGTNCYVAATGPGAECVVVDPGKDAAAGVAEVVREHRLKPVAVLLTHGHIDHMWSAQKVSDTYGCPTYIHPADRYMLKDPVKALGQGFALGLASLAVGALFREPRQIVELDRDGDKLDLGGITVAVDHTPGHTQGSVVFRVEEGPDQLALTGDTLFKQSVGRTDLPGGSGRDLLTSIVTKLLVLDDDTMVLPGHGERSTIGAERRTNPFLEGLTT